MGENSLRCRVCGQSATTFVPGCPLEEEYMHCNSCHATSTVSPRTRVQYNHEYVATRYARYPTTDAMSMLRRQIIEGVIDLHETILQKQKTIRRGRLLDVGYGNGSFIREMKECGWESYGNDVNPTPYPGVEWRAMPYEESNPTRYRVVTFFDSLEHFESLQEVRRISRFTDWIFVSCPEPPSWFPLGRHYQQWDWKHLRPGEHHHHFTARALHDLFEHQDVMIRPVYYDWPEDQIRGKLPSGDPNIMTVGLQCVPR